MRKTFISIPLMLLLGTFIIFSFNYCSKSLKETDLQGNQIKPLADPPSYCQTAVDPCRILECRDWYNCDVQTYYATYAGKTIWMHQNEGILNFSTMEDLNAVLDQLDLDYETHNANYESQYPSHTAEQLDALDETTGFDEFATYRAFENLFPGYHSRRAYVEGIEEAWLAANMTGTDPSTVDQTFDNSENVIAGPGYRVRVDNVLYTFSAETVTPAARLPECKANAKASKLFYTSDGVRRFRLKVAVHSWWVRSSVKAKVVSFIKKGSRWKRSRASLLVGVAGVIRDNNCNTCANPNLTEGFRKRKELKCVFRQSAQWFRAMPKDIGGTFEAQNIMPGSFMLAW